MNTKATLSAGRPSARTGKSATLASLADQKVKARMNFELTPELHTKLKVYAAKQGKSVKDVLIEYIEQLPD
ncbi:chromosome partitioning protein ParB (plasmid) [Nitrosomonas europaea]|uniref:toxin-antitoxin system HicB family antitoxin n=1 Tax=Nitrosomonas europaea TaxID=915 RepID=UPI00326684BB